MAVNNTILFCFNYGQERPKMFEHYLHLWTLLKILVHGLASVLAGGRLLMKSTIDGNVV